MVTHRGTAALVSQVKHTVRVVVGKRCVAAGCSSTHKNGGHLYCSPKDPIKRKK